MPPTETEPASHFIQQIIAQDNQSGKFEGQVVTRFPPEPNGYLHIGHAKSMCLNFAMAKENGGVCHMRFDDTNPAKEEDEFVRSILTDVKWLGFDVENHLFFSSDHFDTLHEYAVKLITLGKAYVDDLSGDEIRQMRGTLTEPGVPSPQRDRSVAENLDLFARMKAGELDEGQHVLRAKIDMASPNLNMRDPVMYRIIKANHHRTGDTWCIYPMYDFTHGQSDSIEKVTHSICTLEFEDHRPLYDWYLDQLDIFHPQQIEFARLNLTYTILSKRKLIELVDKAIVQSWDDPRMPTLSGMRRRGYSPTAIRHFCQHVGVAKRNNTIEIQLLEHCLRQDLNKVAPRVMAVLDPVKLVITNYPEDQVEQVQAVNNPEDADAGKRSVPFTRELYIERDDFMEDPPKKFFRLGPGREVRLRYAYFVTCTGFVKDETTGQITEIHCTYDPATHGGNAPDGRKVKGTIHWVSCVHARDAEVRLYDHLFSKENPLDVEAGQTYLDHINPQSLIVNSHAQVEPSLLTAKPGCTYQFERLGYFCLDPDTPDTPDTPDVPDTQNKKLVFNRTVTLRDSWAKMQKK